MFGGCEKFMNKLFGRSSTVEEPSRQLEIIHCHDGHKIVESDDSFVSKTNFVTL